MNYNFINDYRKKPWKRALTKLWRFSCLDGGLLFGVVALGLIGLILLYSSSNHSFAVVGRQFFNFILAFLVMVFFAKLPVGYYQKLAPWIFGVTIMLLIVVAAFGVVSKGGQRWLNLGLLRFQPSELMKIAMPMMLAWYLKDKTFPLTLKNLMVCLLIIIMLPVLLIAKQPDLGTAILVAVTGFLVILLAGIRLKVVLSLVALAGLVVPLLWRFMYAYQKMRLLIFLSPESDPFGKGYNIIQSKIAVGSGGFLGKGWLHGSQAHLQFLPEASTDFAFAVYGEEFGFLGCMVLFGIFAYLIFRALYISANAQDTFSRLLAGSLTLSFFCSFFVNIGMVTAILPVVGVPLPFISYGGSSLIIFMASFGVIMSIRAHRRLISS